MSSLMGMNMNLKQIKKIFVCFYLVLLAAVSSSLAQTSYTIIPGVRVGPITKRTSEADLKRIYGKGNVKDTEVGLGEGETVPGTVLFPDDPKRMIEIVWKDQKRKRSPESIHFYGEKKLWKTSEGIGLGTSLKELERLNGRGFELAGNDVMLTYESLGRAAKVYVGGEDPDHPLISPIYGDVSVLPPTLIQIGTNDMFLWDNRKFYLKLLESGVKVRYEEYEKTFHDFMLVGFLPEAKKARKSQTGFLRQVG